MIDAQVETAAPPPPPVFVAAEATGAQTAALSTSINPRLAPQSLEAERSVLGGVLLSNATLYDVLEAVRTEDFYREPHRKIYGAMQDLANRNDAIDPITLADELRKKGELEEVGGIPYLNSLDSAVPAAANVVRYATIVREKALTRRMIEAAHTIARDGYEQLGDVGDFLDQAEQKVFDVSEQKATKVFTPLSVSIPRVFASIEQRFNRQSEITGIATGFEHLDRMTAGLQRGDLIIVAGRPSMGKTSVVMNIAAHVAINQELPVAVFSLEMSTDALTTRLFASEARVDGQRLRNGLLLDTDWAKLAEAADRLFKAPIMIDDSAGLTALEMRAKCRRLMAKHKQLGLVIVDYLQLMRGRGRGDAREQEISEISRGLKMLAKELNVPVIALSQLNRSLEKREDRRPMMSDLRESGALEQDADVICFIYRDEVYNKVSAEKGTAELIIGKQRNGPTGTVHLAFQKDYVRFDNLTEARS